jgi:GPH family glycoside/pentoside/hexuronide:cation symporter
VAVFYLLFSGSDHRCLSSQKSAATVFGFSRHLYSAFRLTFILVCLGSTRSRLGSEAKIETEQPVTLPFLEQLTIAFNNRPVSLCHWHLSLFLAGCPSHSFHSSLLCRQLDGLEPEAEFAQSDAIAVQGTAFVMLFVWSAVSKRVGKKAVYYMGMTLWIIAQGGLFFLQPGQVVLMYFLAVMAGFGVSTAYLVPWSMMPDVIELDELQTGQRREGIFYGFMVLLQKVV